MVFVESCTVVSWENFFVGRFTEEKLDETPKTQFAVVEWFNYKTDLSAGFLKAFDDFQRAKEYAYKLAKQDIEDTDQFDKEKVVTEDDLTDDVNGPGKYGSPYAERTLAAYGGGADGGYCTVFYCVVEFFDGVENEWDQYHHDQYWEELYDGKWYPRYSYDDPSYRLPIDDNRGVLLK